MFAIGAGAGAGIDAMNASEQAIYARRSPTTKVTVRPILMTDRKGILASIAFGSSPRARDTRGTGTSSSDRAAP